MNTCKFLIVVHAEIYSFRSLPKKKKSDPKTVYVESPEPLPFSFESCYICIDVNSNALKKKITQSKATYDN